MTNVESPLSLELVATAVLEYDPRLPSAEAKVRSERFTYLDRDEEGDTGGETLDELNLIPRHDRRAPDYVDVEVTLNITHTLVNGTFLPVFNDSPLQLPTGQPALAAFFKGEELPPTLNPIIAKKDQVLYMIFCNL